MHRHPKKDPPIIERIVFMAVVLFALAVTLMISGCASPRYVRAIELGADGGVVTEVVARGAAVGSTEEKVPGWVNISITKDGVSVQYSSERED